MHYAGPDMSPTLFETVSDPIEPPSTPDNVWYGVGLSSWYPHIARELACARVLVRSTLPTAELVFAPDGGIGYRSAPDQTLDESECCEQDFRYTPTELIIQRDIRTANRPGGQ